MQMHPSPSKLAALPGNTLVHRAHEYMLANLRPADAADPGNPAIERREAFAMAALADGQPSPPSTIQSELAANPFLPNSNPRGSQPDESGRGNCRVYKWRDGFQQSFRGLFAKAGYCSQVYLDSVRRSVSISLNINMLQFEMKKLLAILAGISALHATSPLLAEESKIGL